MPAAIGLGPGSDRRRAGLKKAVDVHVAFRSMHEQFVADRPRRPREIERAAARARDRSTPFIKEHVGVSARRPEAYVDVVDHPEKRFQQIERMDPHVEKRIAALSERIRQRAAGIRWIVGGAIEVNAEDVAAGSSAKQIECVPDDRILGRGVVH
jgi:hypothetical protein